MKFLVDAQLPSRLSLLLGGLGHDSKHTLELPEGNASTDSAIVQICSRENRVLITKDADFLDVGLSQQKHCKLVLLTMGNVSNAVLLDLIQKNLPKIVSSLILELSSDSLIIRS